MSRSLTYLFRGVLGIAVAGSLGFGTTQAFGSTDGARVKYCPDRGADYAYPSCGYGCPNNRGYCGEGGICRCGLIP